MNPQKSKSKHRWLGMLGLFLALGLGAAALVYSVSEWSAPEEAKRLQNPVPPTSAAIGAGMETYMEHCQSCHGENGDGKGEKAEKLSVAPADFTDSHKMDALTDGELFWKITHGRRPMPSFKGKLTDEERWEAVDYIRTFALKPSAATPAPSPRKAGAPSQK